MTEATATPAEEVVIPDTVAELVDPKFTVIDPTADRTCDRHPSTYALVHVELPHGGTLELCGNCGRKHFGYEHVKNTKQENRAKGSDH